MTTPYPFSLYYTENGEEVRLYRTYQFAHRPCYCGKPSIKAVKLTFGGYGYNCSEYPKCISYETVPANNNDYVWQI